MQSAKLTSTQWRGDTGRFPAGGRFNKRRKTNTVCAVTGLLRGEDGGTLDTSSCRKEAELWKKSKQEPRTGLFNPAVNSRPYRPTTSHYLCTTFSPHTAERARTRSIVWVCLDGVEGSKRGRRRAVHGRVKRMKTTVFTGQLQSADAGWSVQPQPTGRENIRLKQKDFLKIFFSLFWLILNLKLNLFLCHLMVDLMGKINIE